MQTITSLVHTSHNFFNFIHQFTLAYSTSEEIIVNLGIKPDMLSSNEWIITTWHVCVGGPLLPYVYGLVGH